MKVLCNTKKMVEVKEIKEIDLNLMQDNLKKHLISSENDVVIISQELADDLLLLINDNIEREKYINNLKNTMPTGMKNELEKMAMLLSLDRELGL